MRALNPLCIYHANCADGFGAAWVVRKYFGPDGVDFHPGVYGEAPPDVKGRDVILVDFSYKRDVLIAMGKVARSILVLDHHKSAAEDLAQDAVGGGNRFVDLARYTGTVGWARFQDNVYQDNCEGAPYARCYSMFDMERSGAGIAWDFFFPGSPRPALLNHIEDRDLWRFRLPLTREIQAAVFSFPYDFAVWDALAAGGVDALAHDGAAIERKHHKDVAELVGVLQRRMLIGGHVVPAANLPYTLTSDAGNLMAQGQPFAACYWDTPDGRVFSLRSTAEGLDVSEIAAQYGGGGHRNAAGFRVGFDRLGEFVAP